MDNCSRDQTYLVDLCKRQAVFGNRKENQGPLKKVLQIWLWNLIPFSALMWFQMFLVANNSDTLLSWGHP